MKLYVWENPYHLDYGHTMVFAIADSLPEARKIAASGKPYAFGSLEFNADDWVSRAAERLGKPDRIVTLPASEWHRWEE